MQNLLQHVQSLKEKKIAEFKKELDLAEKRELGELESQVNALRITLKRLVASQDTQEKSKKEFASELHTRFELEAYRQELLELFWNDVMTSHFSDKKVQEKWLESQLASLSGKTGILRAGESLAELKTLVKKKHYSGVTLEKSEELQSEMGFIFDSEEVTIDSRFSIFSHTLFNDHKIMLYKVAFG